MLIAFMLYAIVNAQNIAKRKQQRTTKEIAVDFSYMVWTNKAKSATPARVNWATKKCGKKSHDGRDLCAWKSQLFPYVCLSVGCLCESECAWAFVQPFPRRWCNIRGIYVDISIFGRWGVRGEKAAGICNIYNAQSDHIVQHFYTFYLQ